ncbi:hypothetical protein L3Q82_022654, partial [Scortum barcoo]
YVLRHHIKHISRSAFYHLQNIAKIRHCCPNKLLKDFTAGPECRCIGCLLEPGKETILLQYFGFSALAPFSMVSRSSLEGQSLQLSGPCSLEPASQSGSERQTQCRCLIIDLKPSFLIKLIVR